MSNEKYPSRSGRASLLLAVLSAAAGAAVRRAAPG